MITILRILDIILYQSLAKMEGKTSILVTFQLYNIGGLLPCSTLPSTAMLIINYK